MLGLSNPSKSSAADASGVTSAVQGFLNNVVAAAGYGAAVETHQQLKQSLTRAILAPRASMDLGDGSAAAAAAGGAAPDSTGQQQQQEPVVVVTGEVSDDDDDEERGTFHLAGSGDSGSLPTYSSSGTPKAAAAAGSAAAGSTGNAAGSAAALVAGNAAAGGSAAAFHGAVVLPASVALLHKDAFLVFRALCKLSIRTSDLVTVSDPTAVRGKVRRWRVRVGKKPCSLVPRVACQPLAV
jgi:brefeldin A-inhibited guanine nucleotide-exchange protein